VEPPPYARITEVRFKGLPATLTGSQPLSSPAARSFHLSILSSQAVPQGHGRVLRRWRAL